jgi:glycosyltransferase involved in cell wall biosynthesis
MRIALVGHACSPILGSEPGITWNWAASLARLHDVTLFAHPQYRAAVDAELAQRPIERLKLHWVETNSPLDPWKPQRSERGIRIHYRMWQSAVLRVLKKLQAKSNFELVHHVSWGSLQQPPTAWKLGLPFVWGPVGGGQTWPAAFMQFAASGRSTERLRNLLVCLTRWNPLVVRAAHHADLILAINGETARTLTNLHTRRVEFLTDYGIQEDWLTDRRANSSPPGSLSMLWGGRCEPRKGLPLILEAMAKVPNPSIRLTAAGDGPCLAEWQHMAQTLGIGERVNFIGRVPWTKMAELFTSSDVLLFPSLRDSQGTIVLEAMARGLPLITLDHQGVGQIVPKEAGVKVPVTTPQETIAGLADAMALLADNPQRRTEMGSAAARCAAENTWAKRAERMTTLYEEVLSARRSL